MALDPSRAPDNPSERALHPTNDGQWHYTKHDSEDAAKAIERRREHLAYSAEPNFTSEQVDARFTGGYLRNDKVRSLPISSHRCTYSSQLTTRHSHVRVMKSSAKIGS